MNTGHVYFIRLNGLPQVKIGATSHEDYNVRISSYKTGAPNGIEVLGVIKTKDPFGLEKEIHKRFSMYKWKNEWYNISTKQVEQVLDEHNHKQSMYVTEVINILRSNETLLNEIVVSKIKKILRGEQSLLVQEKPINKEHIDLKDKIIKRCVDGISYFTAKDVCEEFKVPKRLATETVREFFQKTEKTKRYFAFGDKEKLQDYGAFIKKEEFIGLPHYYEKP
jgi:predicted nucleic-acid-binding protein